MAYWQIINRGDAPLHHYTLRPPSMPIISTTFDTVVLADVAISGILRAAVQAVVVTKVRFGVARRHAHTVHLCREAEQGRTGREVIKRLMLTANMRRVKTCARSAAVAMAS